MSSIWDRSLLLLRLFLLLAFVRVKATQASLETLKWITTSSYFCHSTTVANNKPSTALQSISLWQNRTCGGHHQEAARQVSSQNKQKNKAVQLNRTPVQKWSTCCPPSRDHRIKQHIDSTFKRQVHQLDQITRATAPLSLWKSPNPPPKKTKQKPRNSTGVRKASSWPQISKMREWIQIQFGSH